MQEQLNIGQVEQFLALAGSKAQSLERSTGSLPPVDADGNSDCGFAEEWYAEHEALRTELQDILVQAHEYLTALEGEITKLAHDLAVLSAQEDRLHRDGPRAHFSEAEAKVADLYKCCRKLRHQLIDMIKYIDQLLQRASTKRFPGGIPRKWPGFEQDVSARHRQIETDTGNTVERELDTLFEMDRQANEMG